MNNSRNCLEFFFKYPRGTMLCWPRFSLPLGLCFCLSLAFSLVVPSTFPVPTNISLTCHNFTNVLYWNYSKPELLPEFSVTINGYESQSHTLSTGQTYLDISEYTQDAESYYITVNTQAEGSEDNVTSEGVTFTYSENFMSDITCVVDFPLLEVSVSAHKVVLAFRHPYHVYKTESLNDEFVYKVVCNETTVFDGSCVVANDDDDDDPDDDVAVDDDDMCMAELNLFDKLYGKCIQIHIKGTVNGIPTETYREICIHVAPDKTDWTVIITVLVCSLVGLLILIIMAVIIFKKLTRPDTQSTIVSKLLKMINSEHAIQVPEQPVLTEVTSIGQTRLLDDTDQTHVDLSSSTFVEQTHFPTLITDRVNIDTPFTDEPDEDDDDSGSIQEGLNFNSGNSFSGYDCQKFPNDMGQGDIVEAYGPR